MVSWEPAAENQGAKTQVNKEQTGCGGMSCALQLHFKARFNSAITHPLLTKNRVLVHPRFQLLGTRSVKITGEAKPHPQTQHLEHRGGLNTTSTGEQSSCGPTSGKRHIGDHNISYPHQL